MEDDNITTLPVIGKSKSESSSSQRTGTMASLFDELVTEEELLESRTPSNKRRRKQTEEDEENKKLDVHSTDNVEEDDKENIAARHQLEKVPTPPQGPKPSSNNNSNGRGRMMSSNLSQEEAIRVVSDMSQLTASMAIDVGLAMVKSDDKANDYDIEKPGVMESILAIRLTSITLESGMNSARVLSIPE